MKYSTILTTVRASKLFFISLGISAMLVSFFIARLVTNKDYALATSCGSTHCVSIENDGFSKDELAVRVGEYVEFAANDGKRHNLALGDGMESHRDPHGDSHADSPSHMVDHDTLDHGHTSGTESGEFGDGEAWRVQFKKTGTYKVHDHLQPERNVLIVVY